MRINFLDVAAQRTVEPGPLARWEIPALIIVLLVAVLLRFSNSEAIGISQDHADLATLVEDLVEGRSIPLLGIPSSARFPNSPMTVYVLIFPFMISDSPLFATMYVAALNIIGVGLLWFLARRYVNPRVALLASLAYAVNPWAVGYSRSLWAQDYHTPIFLLGLVFGLYGFVEGKRWAQILCLPVLVIAMQIHFVAWLYVPVYLWLVWIGRKRVSKSALVISFLLAALTLLPYALGILQSVMSDSNIFTNVQTQQRELSVRNLVKSYGHLIWLTSGLGIEQYSGRDIADTMLAIIGMPTLTWVALLGFFALGLVNLLLRKERWFTILILLWAIFPTVVFTIPIVDVVAHYFVPGIPVFCLIIAIGVDTLLSFSSQYERIFRWATLVVLAVVFSTQAIFSLRLQRFLEETYLPTQFGSGPSLRRLAPVQDALWGHEDVVLINSGDWVDWATHGAPVWSFLLRHSATCTRDLLVTQNFVVLPKGPFTAALTPRTVQPPIFEALYHNENPTVVDLRPGEGEYLIYSFEQSPEWTGQPLTPIEPVTFQNGVSLNGYTVEDGHVTLEWTLPAAVSKEYDYVIRFADADKEMLDQQTFSFWPGENWCAGDRLISWQDIEIPDMAEGMTITMQGTPDPASESFAEIALS